MEMWMVEMGARTRKANKTSFKIFDHIAVDHPG
jgi:hypothetical protein